MVRIVTDSGSALAPNLHEQYDIPAVPLMVQIGSTTYHDGVNLTQQEFLRLLPQANPLPTTSQPSPADFEAVYSDILKQGDEIVSIHLSSKLSGTYNSARNAKLAIADNAPISVIDSESASVGAGLLSLAAARMAEAGRSRETIAQRIEALVPQILLVLTLDTLEYLKKGGRISGASAFIGGLLKFKPVLVLKEGKIEPAERPRSRRKAMETMVDMLAERFGSQPVWAGAADAMADDVDKLIEMARGRLNVQEFVHSGLSPAIATHTGPNTLGLVAMPAPEI
jgi:DegV family protein with EDD domain